MSSTVWDRLLNALQVLLPALATIVIISLFGWILAGPLGVGGALVASGVLILLRAKLSPRLILMRLRARPLDAHMISGLSELLNSIAQRAGLPTPPALYYLPSATVNAFAVGTRNTSAVVVTEAMLRTFSPREIAGVFAHEVSHIRANDLWIMAFVDLCSRLTRLLATAAQILLLLNLPLLVPTASGVHWAAIVILVFMPLASALIQLSLARAHEHSADLGAVGLTGDPHGLVMALEKIAPSERGVFKLRPRPQSRLSELAWFRTHPLTERRIERLRRFELVLSPP
ncbi:MAG: M48 family metalloprotease [Nitrococcus mobilis]|nr:M48 family metalloprotease [Nitrococcus mobilis]